MINTVIINLQVLRIHIRVYTDDLMSDVAQLHKDLRWNLVRLEPISKEQVSRDKHNSKCLHCANQRIGTFALPLMQ